MAVPKTLGLENEYGIVQKIAGQDYFSAINASSLVINAYVASVTSRTHNRPYVAIWDFIDESPDNDTRTETYDPAAVPEIERNLVNAVLTNGARYYVDHAHPEISTPECANAKSAVLYDRAAELIAIRSMQAVEDIGTEGEIVLYKNNSDGKGNSYGTHENYLVDRSTPFARIVRYATLHFVTRSIFCGAGKVGAETPGMRLSSDAFQITQRADFIEEEIGLETTLKRPIVNTRDEPHADPTKYRRLHVILGDANMSQVATFLKLGTTAMVLALAEDDAAKNNANGVTSILASPVAAIGQISHDISLTSPLLLEDGRTATALNCQWELYAAASAYIESHGPDDVGGEVVAKEILHRWESVLAGLESDPMSMATQVDWVAKLRLLEGYRQKHDLRWGDARIRAMDIQYHDLRPERCLATKAGLETLVDDADAEVAMTEPPPDTRAYFRGKCLQRFAENIVAANWDSVVFETSNGSLRRVTMMEPERGTASHLEHVFDQCQDVDELLTALSN